MPPALSRKVFSFGSMLFSVSLTRNTQPLDFGLPLYLLFPPIKFFNLSKSSPNRVGDFGSFVAQCIPTFQKVQPPSLLFQGSIRWPKSSWISPLSPPMVGPLPFSMKFPSWNRKFFLEVGRNWELPIRIGFKSKETSKRFTNPQNDNLIIII